MPCAEEASVFCAREIISQPAFVWRGFLQVLLSCGQIIEPVNCGFGAQNCARGKPFFQAFNYSMGQVRRDVFARWRSVAILHVNPIYENEKPWPSTCSESTGCSRMLLSNSITSREQEMMETAFQASGRCQQLGSRNSQTQLLHEEVKQMRQCKNS